MVLGPFAETKGARLPGRNPAFTINVADSNEKNGYQFKGP